MRDRVYDGRDEHRLAAASDLRDRRNTKRLLSVRTDEIANGHEAEVLRRILTVVDARLAAE